MFKSSRYMIRKEYTTIAFLLLFNFAMALDTTWHSLPLPIGGAAAWYHGVCFTSSNIGFAVGDGGVYLETTNAGQSWTQKVLPTSQDLINVEFITSMVGLITAEGDSSLVTTNGGSTWQVSTTGAPGTVWHDVSMLSANLMYMIGYNGTTGLFARSTNGGTSWSRISLGAGKMYGLHFITADSGWAVGEGGKIVFTSDSGNTWTPQTSGTTNDLWSIDIKGSIIHIGGSNFSYLRSINKGSSWSLQTNLQPGGGAYKAIFMSSTNIGYIRGAASMLKTIDGGANWTMVAATPVSGGAEKIGLFFINDTIGYTAQKFNKIFKTYVGSEGCSYAEFSISVNNICPDKNKQILFGAVDLLINSAGNWLNTAYEWYVDGNLFGNQQVSNYTFNNSGMYEVLLVAHSTQLIPDLCPADTAFDTVFVKTLTPISLPDDTLACGAITLNAGGTYSDFLWSTLETSQTIVVNGSGDYWVFALDQGCNVYKEFSVTIPTPDPNFPDQMTACNEIILDAGNIVSGNYLWSTGGTTQSINVFTSGSYWVEVTDQGCSNSDTVDVTILPDNINEDFLLEGEDKCMKNGYLTVSIENTSQGPVSCAIWDFGDNTGKVPVNKIKHTYTLPGDYTISLVLCDSTNGCHDTVYQNISIAYCTGIDNINHAGWNIFPNPAVKYIELYSPAGIINEMLSVSLVNSVGQTVILQPLVYNSHSNNTLDVSDIARGIYLIKILSDDEVVYTSKILINE